MRGFRIPAAARAPMFLALALAPAAAPSRAAAVRPAASARKPFAYSTTGVVDTKGAPGSIAGPAQLEFRGVTGGTFVPGSGQPIQLGQFVVPATTETAGQATTYDRTPFAVQVRAPAFDKTSTVPLLHAALPSFGRRLGLKTVTRGSLLIRGHLDGTVSPGGEPGVVATVDSIKPGGLEMHSQDHVTKYAFPVRFGDLKLPPSWTMSALSGPAAPAAQGLLPTPAPEPSTLASGAALLVLAAWARRRRRRGDTRPTPSRRTYP